MKLLLLAFAWPAIAAAQEPAILIHQKIPQDSVSDIAIATAQEFSSTFALNPIVWSVNDPQFRDAIYNRLAPEGVFDPTQEQLESVARNLKAPYWVFIVVKSEKDLMGTIISVYRTGQRKPVWTKTLETRAEVGGVGSRVQAEQALARSWGFELRQGVFKDYIRKVDIPDPDPNQGTTTTPDPAPTTVPDAATLRQQVNALIEANKRSEALTLLWDSVDQAPFDLPTRQFLIDTLVRLGQNQEAADECRRALLIWPGEEGIRLANIRCLLALGQTEVAAEQLQEAEVRNPKSLAVIELKGNVALLRGLYQQARNAFMTILSQEPRPTVQASLALTVALEGDTAEARRLMATMPPVDDATISEIYAHMVSVNRLAIDRLATELREVLRLGRLQPGNQSAIDRAQRVFKACEGLDGVLETARVPELHSPSHEARILAQKLLTQASAEIFSFVRSGNPEAGDEATISLGEALRSYAEADQAYNDES
ncbi:MAG: hypothetical protein IT206_08090 [Fimbriimonadaceae bacterium]|nr:hypothetical protein [Fimbriimonadaceae bacterium]